MNVLMLNGSAKPKGCTYTALEEIGRTLAEEGVSYEIFQLGPAPIRDCIGCGQCTEHGCIFTDDAVNAFIEKARHADGFVFGTPVYYAHPSGRIFSFLDRAFYSNGRAGMPDAFRFKPGASVAVARRGGISASFDALNKYFGISQMPVAGSTYWNMVHGAVAEDAPQDEEGMQTLRNLARNMIWMMRCFAVGREQGVPYPETEKKVSTNFVRR